MVKKIGFLFLLFISLQVFSQTDSVKLILASSKHDTIKIKELIDLAGRYENLDLNEEAITILSKASELSLARGATASYVRAERKKAYVMIAIDNYDEATKVLNDLLDYSVKNRSITGQAHANRLLSVIEMYKGNMDVAVKGFLKTQKLWNLENDSISVVMGLADLGMVFYYQHDYQNAVRYWKQTIDFYIAHNELDHAISGLSNIGLAYVDLQKYDEAEKSFNAALPFALKANDRSTLINLYTNLSTLEYSRNNYDKAISYSWQSIKLLENTGEDKRMGSLYLNLGEMYRLKKDYASAKTNLFLGLSLIKKAEDLSEYSHAYQNISEYYRSIGNYQYALAYRDTFYGFRDSIYSIEKQEQISQLEKEFDTKQKEEQISLLNKDKQLQNVELKKQRNLIYFFLIGSILLFILVFFIYRSYKIKRIANFKLELQKKEIWNQKILAEEQKSIIEEKNKEIIDSITYAKRIQNAMLTNDSYINEEMKSLQAEYFILFKPKDIVSGDFYWFYRADNYLYYVTADCTGHGVPGGFMSMLGINLLNEIIIERNITDPGQILSLLRDEIIKALKTDDGFTKDGMDATLCKINVDTKILEYASANNPFYIIRDSEIIEHKAQKMPVGYLDVMHPFVTKSFQLHKNDTIYTYTDGFADQFGGPKGKKLMHKQLEKTLLENSKQTLESQKQILSKSFEEWKGHHEQVDDVCIIGVKI